MRQHQGSSLNTSKFTRPNYKRVSSTTTTASTSPGALLGPARREQTLIEQSTPDMAACFIQYCAMCEKQITHPSSSILYCSESCRRKDSIKPLSAANIVSTSPMSTPPSSPRQILPPRIPTGVNIGGTPSIRIPPDNHSYKPDLDPTEWKPKLPHSGAEARHNRHKSEAARYLAQFHRTTIAERRNEDSDTPFSEIKIELPTVATYTPATMMDLTATALSTPALSLGSTNASSSSWSVSTSNGYGYVGSLGYDLHARPLPPRQNRWYSSSPAAGVDLVTPHIPPPKDAYAKKEIVKGGKRGEGLGAFFGSGNF